MTYLDAMGPPAHELKFNHEPLVSKNSGVAVKQETGDTDKADDVDLTDEDLQMALHASLTATQDGYEDETAEPDNEVVVEDGYGVLEEHDDEDDDCEFPPDYYEVDES